jgi:hypothetical protein
MADEPLRIPDRSYHELRVIVKDHLARCFDVPRFVITDRMNRGRLWPR